MRPATEKCSWDGAKAVESAGFPCPRNAPGGRILLADDSEDIRALVAAYLEHTPHHLEIAADGEAAVEKFGAGHFDLVLMDIQMPVMDGYAAARAIRHWEAERGAPRAIIVALTGGALEEDAHASGQPTCDGQLSKPFRMEAFLNAIEERFKAATVSGYPYRQALKSWFPHIWRAAGRRCRYSSRLWPGATTKPFASWGTISKAPARRMDSPHSVKSVEGWNRPREAG